jgi:cell pole-organizing protein PopZ
MKEDLSIDQILSSIRHVILGKKNDRTNLEVYSDEHEDVYELKNLATDKIDSNESNVQKHTPEYIPEEQNSCKKITKDLENNSKQQDKQEQSDQSIQLKTDAIENVVIELIKPHLQTWIDNNLSRVIKTLVEKEINKIISDEKRIIDKLNNQ